MTDEELLTEYLRTKDDGLLTKLYEQMHDGLWAVARSISPNDADDILQDAFCKLSRLGPQDVNSGFMVKMIKNLAICRNRCRKQKKEVSLDAIMRPDFGHKYDDSNEPIDETDSVETQMEQQELWDEVAAAIASLPPEQREAVELYYGHGRTVVEAAGIMGADYDAVKTWIRRGRDRLHEVLVLEHDCHIQAKQLRRLLESMYANAG